MSAVMITWFLTGIVTGLDVTETDKERRLGNFTREEAEHEELAPPDHKDGGLPLISDSVFSLIIMVYVLLAFFFVFFLFCWRRGPELSTHKVKLTSLFVLTHDMVIIFTPGLRISLSAAGRGRPALGSRHPAHTHRGELHHRPLDRAEQNLSSKLKLS